VLNQKADTVLLFPPLAQGRRLRLGCPQTLAQSSACFFNRAMALLFSVLHTILAKIQVLFFKLRCYLRPPGFIPAAVIAFVGFAVQAHVEQLILIASFSSTGAFNWQQECGSFWKRSPRPVHYASEQRRGLPVLRKKMFH